MSVREAFVCFSLMEDWNPNGICQLCERKKNKILTKLKKNAFIQMIEILNLEA